MHEIEPFYNWLKYYDPSLDSQSPFYGKEYNYDLYSETIYGYFIDPAWDSFGSETLYIKILFADYNEGYAVLEFIGEWNDAIGNDVMLLKRSLIEVMISEGISKFILIGENIMNFHGSDDSYYEEWLEDVKDDSGWIIFNGLPGHVREEMKKFNVDHFITIDESVYVPQWRTLSPWQLFDLMQSRVQRRLN